MKRRRSRFVSARPFASVELMQQHCQKTMGEIRPPLRFSQVISFRQPFLIVEFGCRLSTLSSPSTVPVSNRPKKTMIRRPLAPCRLWYAICL